MKKTALTIGLLASYTMIYSVDAGYKPLPAADEEEMELINGPTLAVALSSPAVPPNRATSSKEAEKSLSEERKRRLFLYAHIVSDTLATGLLVGSTVGGTGACLALGGSLAHAGIVLVLGGGASLLPARSLLSRLSMLEADPQPSVPELNASEVNI